ncbi:hypothetical protein C483_05403 [Natrialba hulunbeirensis JCM 10989]|uniref:DUF3006 family protein n=1 Tax=Natrialba hulunbeirensis JCM 10989 TaxID=1227493 RepID=M0A4W3_9EURY|nr:DUF3006 family protein [Natrialba hulunbeirensis]ELY93376.1 hypothetical protein C483_05403 [Natrialba hulunbeirensis JCM 10989]
MTADETPTTATAVLDRIVDGETAVLLLEGDIENESGDVENESGNDETATSSDSAGRGGLTDEMRLDIERVPDDGRHEGAVFEATVERDDDGEVSALETLTYRPDETETRRETAQDRFDELSERLSDR